MASTEAKAKRRAEALNKLSRLSELLADNLNVEVPNIRPSHADPELARILQVEAINGLLEKVLEASGVATESNSENLGSMTKAELLTLADERGIEVPRSATKAKIIEALNA